jgi:uncharacterized SAM-binding protein YcdF (DUF218 family)
MNKTFRLLALLLGGLLLAHCAYLVSVKVTHFGVIVPAGIGAGLLAWAWGAKPWHAWLQARAWRVRLWRWFLVCFGAWLVSLLGYFAFLHSIQDTVDDAVVPHAIVVLGSSTPNAQASPVLVERLRKAYQLAQQYPQVSVVVSGGVDFRQVVSEARVMADYLQSLGLPADRLVLEDQSTSTYENMVFSARALKARGISQDMPILVITSDFHTLRAGWIATRAGWEHVRRAGSPTPLYMRYNAWTREYFACLSGILLREF